MENKPELTYSLNDEGSLEQIIEVGADTYRMAESDHVNSVTIKRSIAEEKYKDNEFISEALEFDKDSETIAFQLEDYINVDTDESIEETLLLKAHGIDPVDVLDINYAG